MMKTKETRENFHLVIKKGQSVSEGETFKNGKKILQGETLYLKMTHTALFLSAL